MVYLDERSIQKKYQGRETKIRSSSLGEKICIPEMSIYTYHSTPASLGVYYCCVLHVGGYLAKPVYPDREVQNLSSCGYYVVTEYCCCWLYTIIETKHV